jgi:hypothetical protein
LKNNFLIIFQCAISFLVCDQLGRYQLGRYQLDTAISWVAITWIAISWFAIAWMLSVVSGPLV